MALPHESPPPDGDVSRQTGALVAIWVLFGISSVVMVLRLFAQVSVLRRLGLDDGLMIVAWVSVKIVPKDRVVDRVVLTSSNYRSVKRSIRP